MTSPRRFLLILPLVFAAGVLAQNAPGPPPATADSLPVFRSDSAKAALIQSIESGKAPADSHSIAISATRAESLDVRLHQRHVFIGGTLSFAFADLSALQLFEAHMANDTAGGLTTLQPYEPVPVYFPVGLLVGIPVFPYLDIWLRTESFWYRNSALSKNSQGQAQEFWYAVQGDFAGIGARYLVPVSLLSVVGHPGLYVAYTQFWNFGPTGMYASTGSVRAKTNPYGAGYEVQAGFQQDFTKRWSWTGGLAFTNFSFTSKSSWQNILPDGPAQTATWTLRSLRLTLQGFYQFGIASSSSQPSVPNTVEKK